MIDLNTATLAELEAEYLRLAGVVTEAGNDRLLIEQAIARRKAEAEMRERVGRMTPLQKEALLTVLTEKPQR